MRYILLLLLSMITIAYAGVPTESSADYSLGMSRDYITELPEREDAYTFGGDVQYFINIDDSSAFVFEMQTKFLMHSDMDSDPVSPEMYRLGALVRANNFMFGIQHESNGQDGQYLDREGDTDTLEIEDNRNISRFLNSAVIRYYMPVLMVELATPVQTSEYDRDVDDITAYRGVTADFSYDFVDWFGIYASARTGTKNFSENVTASGGVRVALNPSLDLVADYTKGYSDLCVFTASFGVTRGF